MSGKKFRGRGRKSELSAKRTTRRARLRAERRNKGAFQGSPPSEGLLEPSR